MGRQIKGETPNKFEHLFEASIFCVALMSGRSNIAATDICAIAYPLEKPYGYRWAVETELNEVVDLAQRLEANGFKLMRLRSIDDEGKEWDNTMLFYRPRLAISWQKYVYPHRRWVQGEVHAATD